MSDSTFEKILVKDDRLACITDKVKFAVTKGGQNITSQTYPAVGGGNSTSSHTYNITVPSLETIVSREVLWESTVTIAITGVNKPPNEYLVNVGVTDALASFPLHKLVNTIQATINNNTVSVNMADIQPIIERLLDPEEMATYDCMTPTTLDFLADYNDGVYRMPYQIDITSNNSDGQTHIRPAVYQTLTTGTSITADTQPTNLSTGIENADFVGARTQGFISYPGNVLSYDINRNSGNSLRKPRGSWKILQIFAINTAGVKVPPRLTDTTVYVTFHVTEPLLLSPFVFGSGLGKAGFYGISTMNFQMNFLANANRAWRCACPKTVASPLTTPITYYYKTASISSFTNPKINITYLTPHPEDALPSRNCVPYYDLPLYRTANLGNIAPISSYGNCDANGNFASYGSSTSATALQSSNIQLSGIPDKLIIFARKINNALYCNDADTYLTIYNVNITFNNQAGICSTMTPEQLYRASVQSGLRNMTWEEFSGNVVSVSGSQNLTGRSGLRSPYSGLGANMASGNPSATPPTTNDTPGFQLIPTTGSIIVLNFAEIIQITESFYAPGPLGSFNLQVKVMASNNTYYQWNSSDYELVVMTMQSGVLVNERGTSSTFINLLTKQDVLDTSAGQVAYSHHEIRRMIGGGFLDSLKSNMSWLASKIPTVLPYIKNALATVPHPYAQTGSKVLETLGYGKNGDRKRIENRLM